MEDLLATLRRTNERLAVLAESSTARVLEGSSDLLAMAKAYEALGGDVTAADGVEALRIALRADGVDEDVIDAIESLYLNTLVGI